MTANKTLASIERLSSQGDLVLDRVGLILKNSHGEIVLSYFEMRLIESMTKAEDNLLSRHDIAHLLECDPYDYESRALEKFISRLRSKIKKTFCFDALQCIRGLGYGLSKNVFLER
jgi:DNA-binding response OmpR family regulator